MAGTTFVGNIGLSMAKFVGIALVILAFIFGTTIIFNFGTLMKVGFFVLGMIIAKKIIFGGK